jgi:hypothetical protein
MSTHSLPASSTCLTALPCLALACPALPTAAQEKSLRVYSRNASPQHVRAVHEAFESWIRSRFGSKVSTSTPCKPPLPPPPRPPAQQAGGGGGGGDGGKRTRGLFAGSDDEGSPSNLVKTKQQRQ